MREWFENDLLEKSVKLRLKDVNKPKMTKQIIYWIGVVLLVPIGLLLASVLLDEIPMSAARPPANMKTIEDFQMWKTGAIKGMGTYENAGRTYMVMLAPAGRYLASGPSAYLFDEKGRFVDWTADMGDFYTVKNHFDLASGHVKNIQHHNIK